MPNKSNQNREILNDLIDKIKEIKRISQGKISLLAGYETENYLAEAKSTNNVSDNIIKSVSSLLEKARRNPDVLDSSRDIQIKDPRGLTIENQIEIIASYRVILSILAEIQSSVMKEKMLPTQLHNIYRKMVKDEVVQVRDELRTKS